MDKVYPRTLHVNYSGVFLHVLLSTNTGRWQHQLQRRWSSLTWKSLTWATDVTVFSL